MKLLLTKWKKNFIRNHYLLIMFKELQTWLVTIHHHKKRKKLQEGVIWKCWGMHWTLPKNLPYCLKCFKPCLWLRISGICLWTLLLHALWKATIPCLLNHNATSLPDQLLNGHIPPPQFSVQSCIWILFLKTTPW